MSGTLFAFALATNVLLVTLKRLVRPPELRLRAYADDIAMVLRNPFHHVNRVLFAISDFARASKFFLKPEKCVWIPLASGWVARHISQRIAIEPPAAARCSICAFGNYLGFLVGYFDPWEEWKAAVLKFHERSRLIHTLGCGYALHVRYYNSHCASILAYLLQLVAPIKQIGQAERYGLMLMANGPYNSTPLSVAKRIRLFGFPIAPTCLERKWRASQYRVVAADQVNMFRAWQTVDDAFQSDERLLSAWPETLWGRSNLFCAKRKLDVSHSYPRCGGRGAGCAPKGYSACCYLGVVGDSGHRSLPP